MMSYIDERRGQKESGIKPEKNQKKYKLKKVPLKRPNAFLKKKKGYRIPKQSKKRVEENEVYKPISERFRKEHPMCVIKSPVCTKFTQGVHHTEGRVGSDFTDESKMLPACNACNGYIESHSQWAKENGFKKANYKSKLSNVKKIE